MPIHICKSTLAPLAPTVLPYTYRLLDKHLMSYINIALDSLGPDISVPKRRIFQKVAEILRVLQVCFRWSSVCNISCIVRKLFSFQFSFNASYGIQSE